MTISKDWTWCLLFACWPLAQADSQPLPGFAGKSNNTPATVIGTPLTRAELAVLRGGFVGPDGLRFSFSFDRVTHLNGEALSDISVIIPMFNLIDPPAATAFTSASQSVTNLQALPEYSGMTSGLTNTLGRASFPTLIQNALDNQHIENLTLINLDIFGTDALRGTMIRKLVDSTSIDSLNP